MFNPFRRRPSARPAVTPRLSVNALDRRDLPSVTLSGGILTLGGTAGRDVANVYTDIIGRVQVQFRTNATPTSFGDVEQLTAQPGEIIRVVFNGYGGDDYLNNTTSIQTYAYGGFGNDELRAGGGNDILFGNDGADRLYGNAGNDRLDGGVDGCADTLVGGAGADTFKAEWVPYSPWNLDSNDYNPADTDHIV